MSALHGHPIPNIDPARTGYNFFQGPSTDTAQIREMADRRTRAVNPNRIRLDNENRQLHRRRDYQLFQQLQAQGVVFPRSLTLNAIIDGYLEERQELALFEHLQSRGAFNYPNMDKFFQRQPARTDEEIYEMLRVSKISERSFPLAENADPKFTQDLGLFWQPYGTWEKADGIIVFLCRTLGRT